MDILLTIKQLQDLLRVDRITIYRMLKDGRLRGFKVGGQWRFSRAEIEAWLNDQRDKASGAPADTDSTESADAMSSLLPLSCIRAIQDVCAEAMGLAVVTTEMDGSPLTVMSNSCDFCTLVLSTERGQRLCAQSWSQQPDGQVRPCHAGLLGASLTIAVGDEPVAITAACQFATTAGNQQLEWQPRIADLATSLNLPEAELSAAMGSVHATSRDYVFRVPRLLQRVADTFSEIGEERLKLLGRLEKIAEMSRISH